MTQPASRIAWLLFTAMAHPIAVQAQQQRPPERIGGTVVSAVDGRPLAHAKLTLQVSKTFELEATTVSGDDGHFQFEALPPGRYQLRGTANGFLPGAYLEHDGYFAAVVTGAGLPTASLVLALTPAGSISGHLSDENGDPPPLSTIFPNAQAIVSLYCDDPAAAPKSVRQCGQQQPAPDGSFEFVDLKPGRYYLAAHGQPWYAVHPPPPGDDGGQPFLPRVDSSLDVAYPITFYPHALSSDAATPIALGPGEQVTADLQFAPQKSLSIALPLEGRNRVVMPTVYRELFGTREPVAAPGSVTNNVAMLSGLTSGDYVVEFHNPDTSLPSGTVKVTLADQAVAVDAPPPVNTVPVTIHVYSSNGKPAPKGTMVSLFDQVGGFSRGGPCDGKGMAVYPAVPPGDYRFVTSEGEAITRVSVDGRPLPDRQLHLEEGKPMDVVLNLGSRVAIDGKALLDGKPAPGALVLLVPAESGSDPDLFRLDEADMDGGFTLNGVVPGNYLLVAIQDGWHLPRTDIHALETYLLHAKPLVVPSSAKPEATLNAGTIATQHLRP